MNEPKDPKLIMMPPPEAPEKDAKFDVAAFNAEIARIVLVGKTWLAGLSEARRTARVWLPSLNDFEREVVYDADLTAMRIISESILSMDRKPLCEEKPQPPTDGSEPTSVGSTD